MTSSPLWTGEDCSCTQFFIGCEKVCGMINETILLWLFHRHGLLIIIIIVGGEEERGRCILEWKMKRMHSTMTPTTNQNNRIDSIHYEHRNDETDMIEHLFGHRCLLFFFVLVKMKHVFGRRLCIHDKWSIIGINGMFGWLRRE
jgi:hypothetical protein